MPLVLLLALSSGLAANPSDTALTRADQVRALGLAAASNGVPARLEGVVTYAEPQAGLAFIQDAQAGVSLQCPEELCRLLKPGDRFRVEGITAAGNFSPVLKVNSASAIQRLGPGSYPDPLRLGIEELQRGTHDSQWIEMRGVIRVAGINPQVSPGQPQNPEPEPRLRLEVNTAQGRYSVIIPWAAQVPVPPGLIGSAVRLQGVLGSIINKQGQWVGLLVFVPSVDQVVIEREALENPWEMPISKLSDLYKFSPAATPEKRVRLSATVLRANSGYIAFVRTPEGPLEIRGVIPQLCEPGTLIDIVGYPSLQNKRLILDDCLVRVLGRNGAPEPMLLSIPVAFETDRHGELVRIRGELVQNTRRLSEMLFIVNCDSQPVEAVMPESMRPREREWLASLKPGSVLELTGVAQVLTAMQLDGSVRPHAFRILMGSAADVTLVRSPPWWTPARLAGLVAALLAALGLAACWVVLLRRQVTRQTRIIREKVEREAIWRDRSRIAEDIHDDLGASLTQVGFLSQRIQASRQNPEDAAVLADHIEVVARSSVRALDEIVWAVNPRHDSLQSLADYLVKLATESFALTPIQCMLDVPAVLPDVALRAELRHNLALAVKEALHNVVKHSRGHTASLSLAFQDGRLEVTLRDDGIGFKPGTNGARRNGLENMQRRLKQIGGDCFLETGPGQGTRITFSAPITPTVRDLNR